MKILSLVFALLLAGSAQGQVSQALPLIGQKGTTTPAACTIGQLFFKTDATAGNQVYTCSAANTWTQILSGGGGGAGVFSTVAIGGASIGSNALAVTGTAAFNNIVTLIAGTKASPALAFGSTSSSLYARAGTIFNLGDTSTEYYSFGTGGLLMKSGNQLAWSSSTPDSAGGDAILSRAAANNIKHGVDAAAPAAQTISTANVSAGTSNTAGANLTMDAGQGTGTGPGGSWIVRVAPAGSTGSSQNALATAVTVDSTLKTTFAGNVVIPGSATAIDSAWTSTNPTITSGAGTITTVSATTTYKQIGKTVIATTSITLTTNGTGSSYLIVPLPVTARAANVTGSGAETSATGFALSVRPLSATQLAVTKYDNTYLGGNGYTFFINYTYEAA